MSTTKTTVPAKCGHCSAPLASPVVCATCHSLYTVPASATCFELLGLPRRFEIDTERLNAAYRSIARNIHPDRFSGQSPEMVALATRLSAEVNRAYDILKDPVSRAAYMLELAGGPGPSEVRDVPGNLLAEVMMMREEIDAARQAGKTASLAAFRRTVAAQREGALEDLAEKADRLSGMSDEERRAYRQALNAIKYYDNLLAELGEDPLADAGSDEP